MVTRRSSDSTRPLFVIPQASRDLGSRGDFRDDLPDDFPFGYNETGTPPEPDVMADIPRRAGSDHRSSFSPHPGLLADRADARRGGEGPGNVRTSKDYPIYLDFVDQRAMCGRRGRLGMTFAPGKVDPGGHTANWQRDLDHDLADLRHKFHCSILVSLTEDHENRSMMIDKIVERGAIQRIEVVRFPVRDVDVPTADRMDAFRALARRVVREIAMGRTVGAHCRGGLGRAGTFAAVVLVEMGWSAGAAIGLVRAARKGTIQTPGQEQFIADYAAKAASSKALL